MRMLGAAVSLLLGVVVFTGIAALLYRATKSGSLAPNSAVGFRTRATLASEQAWHLGHTTALPYLRLCALVGALTCAISLIAAIAAAATGGSYAPAVLIAAIGWTGQLTLLLVASVKANTAAKQVAA